MNHPTTDHPQHDESREGQIVLSWTLADGDVALPLNEAQWWAASLSILLAAVHYPDVLAAEQPDTDPAEVAREVLATLDGADLDVAARLAATQRHDHQDSELAITSRSPGHQVVVSPGPQVAVLHRLLATFANAVLDPHGTDRDRAKGVDGQAAAAWTRLLGEATGAAT